MPLFPLSVGSSGTVSSVALSAPSSILTVSGSPVTTTGTLTLALSVQNANKVWAGPTTGADATPTFRSLVAADIPDLSSVYQPLNTKLTNFSALANSAGVLTNNGSGTYTWAAASTGTVTSVALTVPGFLSVSGSPITTSGTLAVSLATQTANTIFAGPTTGAAAAPTFRSLVAADIPSLSATYALTGAVISSGLTMATARLLGRTTASTGAIEELTVGTSLSLSSGTLDTIQGIRTSDTPRFAGLGIGVSPTTVVDVLLAAQMARFGGASGNNLLQVYTASGSTGLGLWAGGAPRLYSTGSLIIQTNATLGTSSPTGGVDAITVDNSGNVGIGVTPSFNLHVKGSTTTISAIETSGDIGTTGAAYFRLKDSAGNAGYFGFGGTANLMEFVNQKTGGQMHFTAGGVVLSIIAGAVKTDNPSGGTAQPVKFGSYVGGAVSATGYAQIDINGTAYKLLTST